jgi:hypothetical protein
MPERWSDLTPHAQKPLQTMTVAVRQVSVQESVDQCISDLRGLDSMFSKPMDKMSDASEINID